MGEIIFYALLWVIYAIGLATLLIAGWPERLMRFAVGWFLFVHMVSALLKIWKLL